MGSAEVKAAFERELESRGIRQGKESKGRDPMGEIVLTDRLSRLTGTVLTGRGAPASRVTVVAFAGDSSKWSRGTRFVGRAESDAQGRFAIDGLPSGSYLVVAVSDFERGMDTDRQMLEAWRSAATRVTVSDGGSHEVALRVQP